MHSCGITDHGILICWGSNYEQQLDVPKRFVWGSISVAVGLSDTCAIDG